MRSFVCANFTVLALCYPRELHRVPRFIFALALAAAVATFGTSKVLRGRLAS